MKRTASVFLLFIALTVIGCELPIIKTDSSPSAGVDLAQYRKIVIVDFQITGGSDRASFLFHDALSKQLSKLGYDVVGRIKTKRKMKDAGVSSNFATLTRNAPYIGQLFGVDAVIGGTISSFPLGDEEIFFNQNVSITMIDAKKGFTVWFGAGSCKNGTLKGCAKRTARSFMKKFPRAHKRK